ncbi:MAG: hypothetical protein DRP08_07340 [Candidatus Aenigmatarchaeota archaeon]|nr:MAG: hypothetical protein DRP08_07340 [Candidatus Aenigmarchaeota archaeon]
MRTKSLKKAQKTFDKAMNTFIKINGRPIIVKLPAIYADCPNCMMDSLFDQGESINKYNVSFVRPVNIFPGTSEEVIIYPQPFNVLTVSGVTYDPINTNPKILNTVICPVCKGRGKLSVIPEVCINGNFNWHPRSGLSDGKMTDYSAGRMPSNIGIIKTELCNYAICRDATEYVVNGGVRCDTYETPVKKGVGEDAFVEIYVQKVDSSDSTSKDKVKDARVNVRPIATTSEQAPSGTPHTPPNTFADDEW